MSSALRTPDPIAGPPDRAVYVEDGLVITDDGEVLGLAEEGQFYDVTTPDGTFTCWRPTQTRFVADTPDKAEWVLEQIAKAEAQAQAARARLDALSRNLKRMEAQEQRKADFFRTRYGYDLEQLARRELKATKSRSKTYQLAWGSISFRNSAGTNTIVDIDKALEWMEEHAPSLIIIKRSITTTNARAAIEAAKQQGAITSDPNWLASTGPREIVKIETNIQPPGKS